LLTGLASISLLWAITAKGPRALRSYLAVQLGTLLALLPMRLLYTRQSNEYRLGYAIATLAIVAASYAVTRAAGAEIDDLLWSAIFGLFITGLAATALPGHPTLDSWTMLVTGLLVFSLGHALLRRAKYSRFRLVHAWLGVFWMVLAWSFFGFAIEAHRWDALSFWLTYAIGTIGNFVIGRELRRVPPRPMPMEGSVYARAVELMAPQDYNRARFHR
jgi:hypothetical protein